MKYLKSDALNRLREYYHNTNTRGQAAVLRFLIYQGYDKSEIEQKLDHPDLNTIWMCNEYRIEYNESEDKFTTFCFKRVVETF